MATFLDRLRTYTVASCVILKHHCLGDHKSEEVIYMQSQNGNIYRSEGEEPELSAFQHFFESDIPWMRDATGLFIGFLMTEPLTCKSASSAEAVNLWIGTSRSTTSLHHDP